MDYRQLSADKWMELDDSGSLISGYKSKWLALDDLSESDLHIFKDELGQYHLAIEAKGVSKNIIEDPLINGLQIRLFQYRFENGKISQFIDLKCNNSDYLEEFTEVVKDIAKAILENGEQAHNAVIQVIDNWISFWANQRKQVLSEEDQLGLICELITLDNLCIINSANGLKSWTGPLGEIHDFNFTDWNFEIKGTRRKGRIHTVNGIDQLKPSGNKRLAFISFKVVTSNGPKSINLPSLIESIVKNHFHGKLNLIVRFNELLAGVGYSPVHVKEYARFNVEIMESTLFEVDENFPKLTSEILCEPINNRVSKVRYDISLEGMAGTDFGMINWGNYFY